MQNADLKTQKTDAALLRESVVWRAGECGLASFYVYGLLAAGGKIFAFSEGRIERHDKSAHHIAFKQSADGGKTWSANRLIVESRRAECFCNPTPIHERQTNTIFLFYAENFANDASALFVTASADAGETWSRAENLTALFAGNQHGWTLHLPGPGHGIQTRAGRLILQVWHRRPLSFAAAERNYGVSVIYSDDGGATWKAGGIVPLGEAQLNESRIVELANGDLLLNARSGAFVTSPRYFSRSVDCGLNWSAPQEIKSLAPALATDSGFVNLSLDDRDLLVLARPDRADARKDLTIYTSRDAGENWKKSKTIYAGIAGYSDAAALPNGELGVIYGRELLEPDGDVEGNVKKTIFARFKPDQP